VNRHHQLEEDLWGDSEDDPPDHVIERFIARHEHDPEWAAPKHRIVRAKRKSSSGTNDPDRNPRD
jgi:hypothetical protein